MIFPIRIQKNGNIMCMPVFIKKQRINREKFAKIDTKFCQASHTLYLFHQKFSPLLRSLYLINTLIQAFSKKI